MVRLRARTMHLDLPCQNGRLPLRRPQWSGPVGPYRLRFVDTPLRSMSLAESKLQESGSM